MSKLLENLIARGKTSNRPNEQKEIAFQLADLSTHEELLEPIVQKGGVKALIRILERSPNLEAQRFAAFTLANAAFAGFNRSRIVSERIASDGMLVPLLEYVKNEHNDIGARTYCCLALANLAADVDTHAEIIESGAIEALLSVFKSDSIDAGSFAAFAVANLAANANHRQDIVEAGVIRSLVSLGCFDELHSQKHTLAALRSLCISPENRVIAVKEGVLDPLILMASSANLEILREVVSAFNNISTMEENKVEVTERSLCTLIGLVMHHDVIVSRQATSAIANLMENVSMHCRLINERGIAPLIALASHEDKTIRGESCRCIANLTLNPELHTTLLKEGVMTPLVQNLYENEINCQRFASLSLANLATTENGQIIVIQSGSVKPLIDTALDPKNPIEGRRYSALVLANLTSNFDNHATIVQERGLDALFSLCNSPDLMSQYYVGSALTNLSCSLANHDLIVEHGGIQAIITLLSSSDPDVHQQGAASLRGLAISLQHCMKIVQEGALLPLSILCKSDDEEILEQVLGCLCNLSLCDENKIEIVKSNVTSAIISLTQHVEMKVSYQACATLGNLAEHKNNRDTIASEGAILPVINVMRSKYIEVQREAGRVLANLCASESDYAAHIIQGGGHSLLISFLTSQDAACQRVGTLGICNLCTQPRFRYELVQDKVLEPLCSLAKSNTVETEIQRLAVLAIANLASSPENHPVFICEKIPELLIALCMSNDAEVRLYSAFGVVKLAQNADIRQEITSEGGLDVVLYLARTNEPEVRREVIPALSCLSFISSNQQIICRNGGLEPLVCGIIESDDTMAILACVAIANITEDYQNLDRIVASDAIPSLIIGLGHNSSSVKREAARALGNISIATVFGEQIVKLGALPFLVPMIRCSDVETQRMGTMALCNIATNTNNHKQLIDNGLLKPLLHETRLALDPKTKCDAESTRYCLLIIANLTVCHDFHPLLMHDALDILAGYSKHRDIRCRQHAVFCLGNLCSNVHNLEQIVSSGSLKTLLTYAYPSSDSSANVQFQAIAAIRGIAMHPVLRIQLVREGVIDPLVLSSKTDSVEVQRQVCSAFCNLSMSEENKVSLARGNVLEALISMSSSMDRHREVLCLSTIGNISEKVEGNVLNILIENGCLRLVVKLSDSDFPEVQRECARCFALFASKKSCHIDLIKSRSVYKILKLLHNKFDSVCRNFAAIALGNLAVFRESHQELYDCDAFLALSTNVLDVDVSVRRSISFSMANIASNPENHSRCERIGFVRALQYLIKDIDRDIHLQALLAYRFLFESARCRSQLIDICGLPPILTLGKSDDIIVLREFSVVMRNFSLGESSKIEIAKAGGLSVLIDLALMNDTELCLQTMGVIANIAEITENHSILIDSGILQHIKFILRSKNMNIQRECSRALANISGNYAFALTIVSSGVLQPIVGALSSPDTMCQRYASLCLSNLGTIHSNQKKIVQEGSCSMLVSLGRGDNGDLETQIYATEALCNLSMNKGNHAVLNDGCVLNLAFHLIFHDNIVIKNNSLKTVANFASNPTNHAIIVKIGFLNHLLKFCYEINEDTVLAAVGALHGLSTDHDIMVDIIDLNGLEILLNLVKSPNKKIQFEVLSTLCNLSLSGCIGENPVSFLEACGVSSLVDFLKSSELVYKIFSAVTIGNILANISLHEYVDAGSVMEALVEVASVADLETQRCVAYALCNLSSIPKFRIDIVKAGGLTIILSMACSLNTKDRQFALATVRGVAAVDENKRAVMKASVSEAISLGVSSYDVDDRAEAAALLCSLSTNNENKIDIAADESLMVNLIDLLKESDERCLLQTMACLANLSELCDTHCHLTKNRVHISILEHFNVSTDAAIVREATRILCNLSSIHGNHAAIVASGGIISLKASCQRQDAMTSRFAVLGILNLATNQCNHDELLKCHCHEVLIENANQNGKCWISEGNLLDSTNVIQEYDCELKRYSILAMANLAISFQSHPFLIRAHCFDIFKQCLDCDDTETVFNTAFAINKLSVNSDNHNEIMEANLLISLVILLKSPLPEVVSVVAAAIRHLSGTAECRVRLLDAGVFDLLTYASASADSEILREVCSASLLLTLTEKLRFPFVLSSLLPNVLSLCCSSDVEISRIACGTLANVAESKRTHKTLVNSANALKSLVELMTSCHTSVSREASRFISNILSSAVYHKYFIEVDGLKALQKLCESVDPETQLNCSVIFRKLTPILSNHEFIVSERCVLPLMMLTYTASLDVCQQSTAAIRDLASNHNFKVVVAEIALKRVIQLCKHVDIDLRILSMGTLRHLSVNSRIKKSINEEGGLSSIYNCIGDSIKNIDLLRQCAGTLGNMAENGENQVLLIRDGVLDYLIDLVNIDDIEIKTEVAKCFSSLTANPENLTGVFGTSALQALLQLAGSNDECILRDALVSLGNLSIMSTNQHLIYKLGGISKVLHGLHSTFTLCQQYACRLLYRISANLNAQCEVVDAGCIPIILNLCCLPSVYIRKCAIMTLCNLSGNTDQHAKLLNFDVLPSIIRLLSDPNEVVTKYALMTLTNLCNHPTYQLKAVVLGSISQILKLSSSSDVECSQYAGMCLVNISSHRLNRVRLVELGTLTCFCSLTLSTRVEVRRAASLGLYNLSCATENHITMIKSNVVLTLTSMSTNESDLECKRYCTMTLANLASNIETRKQAISKGGLQAVIEMLKDDDKDCVKYAAVALANMANSISAQEQIIIHGALNYVLVILQDIKNNQNSADIDTARKLLILVCNLAANDRNHPMMFQKGIARFLNLFTDYSDAECIEYATLAYCNFSSNREFALYLGKHGAIIPIVRLSMSVNESTKCMALAASRKLAELAENRPRLIHAGILDCLASADSLHNLDSLLESAVTLSYLTMSEPHRVEIAFKCSASLVQMSRNGNVDVGRYSLGALANLAEEVDTHEFISQYQGDEALLSALSHESIEVLREAVRALANYSSSLRHQFRIVGENLSVINKIYHINDSEIAYHSAVLFRKLACNVSSHNYLISFGCLQLLLKLLCVNKIETQIQAICALRDLFANPSARQEVETVDPISLVDLLHIQDDVIQTLCLSAMRHLSHNELLKSRIIDCNMLRPLFRCCLGYHEDLQLQCAGLIANLSELLNNQVVMLHEGVIHALVTLARSSHLEIQRDCSRAFAFISTNEEVHTIMYRQGALESLMSLAISVDSIVQTYTALALKYLAAGPEVRRMIVEDGKVIHFIGLSASPILEYRKTAASAFSSFTLHYDSKMEMIAQGCLKSMLALALDDDLSVKRLSTAAIANLADSLEIQNILIEEGCLRVLSVTGKHNDSLVQRFTARAFSNLSWASEVKQIIVEQNSLPSILSMAKSLDLPCQRSATLTLCNLCTNEFKLKIVNDGGVRPLIFLLKYPDEIIQQYAALSVARLAIGSERFDKLKILNEGCVRPLLDLIRYTNSSVQLAALLALNCLVMGTENILKTTVMTEHGLEPLVHLVINSNSDSVIHAAIFLLGSLAENEEVRVQIVEIGGVTAVVKHLLSGDTEIKRVAGYLLACIAENIEYHDDLFREGALLGLYNLVSSEDAECQDYSTFAIAHLATNKAYQVPLVAQGVILPLVNCLKSTNASKDFAGICLIKLSENLENFEAITKQGGIQALLDLNRSRLNDNALQYKAALTIGQLASNAACINKNDNVDPRLKAYETSVIGTGSRMMAKLRTMRSQSAVTTRKGESIANDVVKYLDQSILNAKSTPPLLPRQTYKPKSHVPGEIEKTLIDRNAHDSMLASQLLDGSGKSLSVKRLRPASSNSIDIKKRNSL